MADDDDLEDSGNRPHNYQIGEHHGNQLQPRGRNIQPNSQAGGHHGSQVQVLPNSRAGRHHGSHLQPRGNMQPNSRVGGHHGFGFIPYQWPRFHQPGYMNAGNPYGFAYTPLAGPAWNFGAWNPQLQQIESPQLHPLTTEGHEYLRRKEDTMENRIRKLEDKLDECSAHVKLILSHMNSLPVDNRSSGIIPDEESCSS